MQLERTEARRLLPWLVAWILVMAASVLLPWRAVRHPGGDGGRTWLLFLALQALAIVPAAAAWWAAVSRRLDLPRGLFLLAVVPVCWSLLLAAAFGLLIYLAS
ncbi:MAG: hypothetical protein R2991_02450 [Thermoanaerobaculia bacterium]